MDTIVDQLTKLFEADENCLMAYLFGSHSKGKANKESDIDIAVYLKDFSRSTTTDLWNTAGIVCFIVGLSTIPFLVKLIK